MYVYMYAETLIGQCKYFVGFRFEDMRCRISDLGCQILDLGFRMSGLGFKLLRPEALGDPLRSPPFSHSPGRAPRPWIRLQWGFPKIRGTLFGVP